jgi:hypothetical protein
VLDVEVETRVDLEELEVSQMNRKTSSVSLRRAV